MKIKSWQFILIMVALFLIIIMPAWGVPTLFAISLSTYIIFLVLLCGNLEKNIYVIAFMITFFTFVMGSMVAIFIFGVQESRSVMNDIVAYTIYYYFSYLSNLRERLILSTTKPLDFK